jgi:hypothetical protein
VAGIWVCFSSDLFWGYGEIKKISKMGELPFYNLLFPACLLKTPDNQILVIDRGVGVAVFRADPRTGLATDAEVSIGDRHDFARNIAVILVDKFAIFIEGL